VLVLRSVRLLLCVRAHDVNKSPPCVPELAAISAARGELECDADVTRLQCWRHRPGKQAGRASSRSRPLITATIINIYPLSAPRVPLAPRPPAASGSAFGCWLLASFAIRCSELRSALAGELAS
jgi:hypothetical protein